MPNTLRLQYLVLSLALLPLPAMPQELRLFEQPEAEAQAGMPLAPEQNFPQVGGQPTYTLRSISRFGDRYEAVLVNSGGQTSKLSWRAGEPAQVLNSGGFTVVAAGPGSLSLQHPAGSNCIAAATVGVQCSAPDRSELKLVAAAPLASNGVMPVMGPQAPAGFTPADPLGINGAAGVAVPADPNAQQVFINPFSGEPEVLPQVSEEERIAREQRQQLRAARLQQFQNQATVDPASVPPGMRVVRTPFGDRMVPIRE